MRDNLTLYKRKDSRWWWLSYSDDQGRIQKSCKKYGLSVDKYTKIQAETVLYEKLQIIPETPGPGTETLSWFKDEILKRIEREGLRKSTIREYRIAFDHLLNIFNGNYLLKDFRKAEVRKIQDALLEKGDSPATINKVCRHLRASFERMADDEIIERNPFRKFTQLRDTSSKQRHLTLADVEKFLAVVDAETDEAMKHLAYIYLLTGLRRREVQLISRSDIDLKFNWIQVQNIKHRDQRIRRIPIGPEVGKHFSWFLKNSNLKYPMKFCTADHITRKIKRWLRKAGLPESLHLHSLRHTFTTLSLEAGESAWKLKDYLDHSSITTTEGYAHTVPGNIIDFSAVILNKRGKNVTDNVTGNG